MYLIFGLPAVARGVAYGATLMFVFLLLLRLPVEPSFTGLFSLAGQAVAWTLAAVWLVGRFLWRPVWRWFPRLERTVYPDLNGCWRGQIYSNWPVIRAKADAAEGKSGPINPDTVDYATAIREKPVMVTVRIRADWFRMSMRLDSADGYSESETRVVAPLRGLHGNAHRLAYLYENRTRNPRPTDASCHEGAAYLSIVPGQPKRLQGVYWTNRVWQRGLNTAGLIDLELVDCNPDADLPPSEPPAVNRTDNAAEQPGRESEAGTA
jgi:hypothetical protein